jgi:hypothetical protein
MDTRFVFDVWSFCFLFLLICWGFLLLFHFTTFLPASVAPAGACLNYLFGPFYKRHGHVSTVIAHRWPTIKHMSVLEAL